MKILKTLIIIVLVSMIFLPTVHAKSDDKLHIITVAEWSDAMILESNGHYAMIDTGEDFSYPDGSNPRYPDREGITKDRDKITQDRLFAHIKQLGIKKFDFIIITHAHSDHIGSAHDVLKTIPTDKLYIKKYSDDRISDKTRLWDNLYGYERALEAAKETKTTVIQDITEKDSHLMLGDIKIDLLNYENEYESDGSLKKVYDDNLNSILAIVNINNTKIFLGGDLENTERHLEEKYGPLIGQVDVMKFNHHVETTKSNTKEFVDKLNPKKIIKTGIRPVEEKYAEYLKQKNISIINAGQLDRAAISLEFNNGEVKDISNDYPHYGFYNENNTLKFKNWKNKAPKDGWTQHNDNWYYFFNSGTVAVDWKYLDNNWYYFNNDGSLRTGIVEDNNNLYYIDKNKGMLTNSWKEIDSNTKYYFKKDGKAAKNEWENLYHFGTDGTPSKNKWIGFLHTNNDGRLSLSDYRNYPLSIVLIAIIIYIEYKIKNRKHRGY
ncbi:MBL fold metallo-hydrolase [uncultured Gemella sp.]|uniref:MBL fold metallo-hydrolase n=1 Tax=uncultured Gemella sp. TaxID=254352 RepID=UPI0028D4762B|nr:MBL fold metallo-hydrolase [uncultured Gemella sp.]